MIQAMLAGVASIRAQQTRMNVIGNNLANVNTTAFKSSRATFQEMMSQTTRGASRPSATVGGRNAIQYGLGVVVGGVETNIEQGSLQATNRPTDLALQGNGFFVVSNGSRMIYTRDGAMNLDSMGNLVHTSTGEFLTGWAADSTGAIDTTVPVTAGDRISIPLGLRTTVQESTDSFMTGNLDSRAAVGDTTESSTRLFDSLGSPHDVKITYTKLANNSWSWAASSVLGEAPVTGSGTLTFDPADGSLSAGSPGAITISPVGASVMTISSDFNNISQLASTMQVQTQSQNGFPAGLLSGFSIGTDGIVTGLFTNGLTRPIAQIAVASFQNVNGLERVGGNLWRNTVNSGDPNIGSAQADGRGAISSGFLEQSNVDIGQEFTDLIVTQRGFQANTRIVTTVDEMLQELVNMKR